MSKGDKCRIDECKNIVTCPGRVCESHRHRKTYYGNYNASSIYDRTPEDILRQNTVTLDNGCIFWTGARSSFGYGNLSFKGKSYKAHRFAWETFLGEIPDGLFCCHHCDNPPCCNVSHLFLGTPKDNSDDMVYKGRGSYGDNSGEKNGQALLTKKEVKMIRQFLDQGVTGIELAQAYTVSTSQISRIKNNKKWKNI